MKIVALTCQIL